VQPPRLVSDWHPWRCTGPAPTDIRAIDADIDNSQGLALDPAGIVYLSEDGVGDRILRLGPDGVVTPSAGTGHPGPRATTVLPSPPSLLARTTLCWTTMASSILRATATRASAPWAPTGSSAGSWCSAGGTYRPRDLPQRSCRRSSTAQGDPTPLSTSVCWKVAQRTARRLR
jgi:hypothetical protein